MDSETEFMRKLLLVVVQLAIVCTITMLVSHSLSDLIASNSNNTNTLIAEESAGTTTDESIDETQLALHNRNFSNEKIVVKDEVSPVVSICIGLGVGVVFVGSTFLFYKISQKRKQKYHKVLYDNKKNDNLQDDLTDESEENE